jgi:putative protease
MIAPELQAELDKVSHRVYSEGFIDGLDAMEKQYYESSAYQRSYQFLGEIITSEKNLLQVNVKARFSLGEEVELVFPQRQFDRKFVVENIRNEDDEQIYFTKPNTIIKIDINGEFPPWGILRKKIVEN